MLVVVEMFVNEYGVVFQDGKWKRGVYRRFLHYALWGKSKIFTKNEKQHG